MDYARYPMPHTAMPHCKPSPSPPARPPGPVAGGCVRDLLLGREPADYDVATSATPREVMRIFPETYAVGAQFGVMLVPLKALGRR